MGQTVNEVRALLDGLDGESQIVDSDGDGVTFSFEQTASGQVTFDCEYDMDSEDDGSADSDLEPTDTTVYDPNA